MIDIHNEISILLYKICWIKNISPNGCNRQILLHSYLAFFNKLKILNLSIKPMDDIGLKSRKTRDKLYSKYIQNPIHENKKTLLNTVP